MLESFVNFVTEYGLVPAYFKVAAFLFGVCYVVEEVLGKCWRQVDMTDKSVELRRPWCVLRVNKISSETKAVDSDNKHKFLALYLQSSTWLHVTTSAR
mgnify:CR=1 FL=1